MAEWTEAPMLPVAAHVGTVLGSQVAYVKFKPLNFVAASLML